jgi:hypothetical protein
MTPSGIEPATFRFVAQYLNHCVTAVLYTLIDVAISGDTNVMKEEAENILR